AKSVQVRNTLSPETSLVLSASPCRPNRILSGSVRLDSSISYRILLSLAASVLGLSLYQCDNAPGLFQLSQGDLGAVVFNRGNFGSRSQGERWRIRVRPVMFVMGTTRHYDCRNRSLIDVPDTEDQRLFSMIRMLLSARVTMQMFPI
ncbi:hypothetical protein BVRB_039730, partial [Beta vulgaris subsp. vulgaris]